jgi:predicted site-specific integrase-resolvase
VWVDEPTVSSSKQKSSLLKQEELLKDEYPEARFISDIALGFNQGDRCFITSGRAINCYLKFIDY